MIATSPQSESANVVWKPIPNSSQVYAIASRANITLYYGARGPGKTACQLMYFAQFVGCGYGSYWKGVIFDREFKHLDDLVAQGNRFFPKVDPGVKWKKSAMEYKWVFSTGEELLLRHVKDKEDYNNFHGHEYPFIGWNELTKHPNRDLFDLFMSVNRCSFVPELHTPHTFDDDGNKVYLTPDGKPLPPIPLRVFATTNSSGPGRTWVKKQFIDVAKPGHVVTQDISYEDDLTGETITVKRTQVAIFGSFGENPYLSHEYKAGLVLACKRDPNKRKSWIEGRWDVSDGGAFDDLWDTRVHILRRIRLNKNHFKINRSFDWGSSSPFACIWWAECNGEEIEYQDAYGRTHFWCPVRGTLIAIAEYYGVGEKPNTGLKMAARNVAKQIKRIDDQLVNEGWIGRRVQSGPADNQIRNVNESEDDTIEKKMQKAGVFWTKSDKSPGSRYVGKDLFRDRLDAALTGEGPAIYVMENCPYLIEQIPDLQLDPDDLEDVDTDCEDHMYDALRYRVLQGTNKTARNVKTRWARR